MRSNFPSLTSIRGLAAWWVVFYHFRTELPPTQWHAFQAFAAYGYLAVDLFFIMSGFVIALSYSNVMSEPTWPKVARFLGFRLARIYPLHAVMLVAFLLNPVAILLFSSHATVGDRYDPGGFVLSLFLVQNWGFTSDFTWNIPAWSISTEWAAYLVFPIIAWVSMRLISRSSHSVVAIASIVILLAVAGHSNGGLDNNIPGFGLTRCLLEFSLGVALYHFWLLRDQQLPHTNLLFFISICILAGGVIARWPDYIYAPIGLFLLIASALDSQGIITRLLNHSILNYVGEISYSTYLVHYFVKDWVKFLLINSGGADGAVMLIYACLIASTSVLLYHGIELPGRRLGRNYTEAYLNKRQTLHSLP